MRSLVLMRLEDRPFAIYTAIYPPPEVSSYIRGEGLNTWRWTKN